MPSAESTGLTDDLWLSAYDSVGGRPCVGDWPLGVGLAVGLIAELIDGGFLELRQGELFRTGAEPPPDPALYPLLAQMAAEEEQWVTQLHGSSARTRRHASAAADRPGSRDWGSVWDAGRGRDDGGVWPAVQLYSDVSPAWSQEETRHRQRGHLLAEWIPFLAYERRAERRVLDRLTRTGLARRREQRRWLGGTTVRYEPFDSVTAATPANKLRIAVQARQDLTRRDLLLGGLFLAAGLHHHTLATLTPNEWSHLADQLSRRLDEGAQELLRVADVTVAGAAMR